MIYEVKIKKLQKSEVELEVSLPADLLDSARKKAIGNFSESLEMPGFRKGHLPANIVVEKVGENTLLEEAADLLLKEHFPKIIGQTKSDIIGRPKISITKLAWNNPVIFKAVFAVMPEFELPDYRTIAKSSTAKANLEKKDESASDKEVDEILLQIRKNKAHFDWHEAHKEEKGHNHPEIKGDDLPPLDDALAKAAGNFKNLEELKIKVRENIAIEKKTRQIEKIQAEIMGELSKKVKLDLPEVLVESETEKSLAQIKADIERLGSKFEDYLKHINKTEADLKKELQESSENKAKIQLIFNKIAEIEKLKPDKEILEHQVKEVMQHYPQASEMNARIYVSTILLNQAVLKLLENQ